MTTILTEAPQVPCISCKSLLPIGSDQPCKSCSDAKKNGLRSCYELDNLWFERFPEYLEKFGKKRRLSTEETAAINLFRQTMHRNRLPAEMRGETGTLTNQEWAQISRPKLKQYRRHVNTATVGLLLQLIDSAEV